MVSHGVRSILDQKTPGDQKTLGYKLIDIQTFIYRD